MLIKTLIVSLERRSDRRERIREVLPSCLDYRFSCDLGINFDGKSMAIDDLQGIQLFNWQIDCDNFWWDRPLKLGEIGCSLAHLELWKLAHEQKLDEVLILEDDTFFPDDFEDKIGEYLKYLNKNTKWDICYLGRCKLEHADTEINDFLVKPGYSHCTFGYMISKKGLKKILSLNFEKNIIPVDEFLPALYIDHPRSDIKEIFPKCLEAYALKEDIVFTLDKKLAGSDTEESSYVDLV